MDSITYSLETYRTCSPEETWDRIKDLLNNIKIINLERIDNLDRIGIPVYAAERITSDENIKIHLGKGSTDVQARVSATMEAIERFSAELDSDYYGDRLTDKPINPVEIKELVLSSEAYMHLVKGFENNSIKGIQWIEGQDIINNCSVEVPVDGVFHPYNGRLFRSNTNGIASGNTLQEAIFHGTLEIIERDAWSIYELSRGPNKRINIEGAKNPIIHELMEKFKEANISITLKDLTSDVGIPTVAAICDEEVWKDPALLCMGVGCHIHPEIAIIRALTEVAQSRATQIHNKREDTVRGDIVRKVGYNRMKKIHRRWFEYDETINVEDMENNAKYNLKRDLKVIKEKLLNAGFDKLIYVDLKKTRVDVVRVIIPKMEVYCMDRDRISPNIKDRLKRMKSANK